jgi:transposase
MEFSREQIRSSIFVALKDQKTPQQTKLELDVAFGKSAPTVKCIKSWFKRFREGKTDMKDATRSGRPKSAVTDRNVEAVRKLVVADPNSTYRNIQGKVSIGSAAVNSILKKKLKCRKLVSR